MEDHHVDRPGVEAQRCVKLTGTNSSIGLIVLIIQCPYNSYGWTIGRLQGHNPRETREPEFTQMHFADLVAIAKRPEPDPIPNSTVKRFSADGTLS